MRSGLLALALLLPAAGVADVAPPAGALAGEATPPAFPPGTLAPDPVLALAAEARAVDPPRAGDWARAEGRVLALGAADRARLLAAVEEPVRWWAPLLNLYPGFGIGSMASRDPRGVWLAAGDGAAVVLFTWGLMLTIRDTVGASGGAETPRSSVGGPLLVVGAVGFVASRVAGVILPFTFHGRTHRELGRALEDAPAGSPVAAALVPLPGGAAGVLAVAF